MNENEELGGRRAIAGFTYQLLATLAAMGIPKPLVVVCADTKAAVLQMDNLTCVSLSPVFTPEANGQDLQMSTGTETVLVQYKYSSIQQNDIGLTELREIFESFTGSISNFPSSDLGKLRFVLFTNRTAGSAIQHLLNYRTPCTAKIKDAGKDLETVTISDQIGSDVSVSKLTVGSASFPPKGNPETDNDLTLKYMLESWFPAKRDKETGKIKPSSQSANKNFIEQLIWILPRLYCGFSYSQSWCEDRFKEFCLQFGLFPNEIEDKLNQGLGELIRWSGSATPVTRGQLINIIAGASCALPLTPTCQGFDQNAAANCHNELESWLKLTGLHDSDFHPRDTTRIRDAFDSCSIVLLEGNGGSGKSVLFGQFLSSQTYTSLIHNTSTSQHSLSAGFSVAEHSSQIKNLWPNDAIGTWAKRQNIDRSIERLRIANRHPNSHILLWLGIDGIDEEIKDYQVIRELIERVLKEPDLRLIMTCRSSDHADLMRWLTPSRTGEAMPNGVFHPITVDIFSHVELEDVLLARLGSDAVDLVREDNSNLQTKKHSRTIREMLRYPRILHALTKQSDPLRNIERMVSGDKAAFNEVAKGFIELFLAKYVRRVMYKELPDASDFLSLIICAAQATQSLRQFDRQQWSEYCVRSIGSCLPPTVKKTLAEAVSGGLLTFDGNFYSWTHEFVVDYLVTVKES